MRKTELLKQEEDLKIQLAKLEESLLEVCTYILLSDSFVAAAAAAVAVSDIVQCHHSYYCYFVYSIHCYIGSCFLFTLGL